ncbi:hypothetical protein N7527_003118 [Penicillium freii]|nr:hypothetical protein N7527_003118 [Penicillium freii]
MLWMALDADQLKTPLIIQQLIRPFFFLPPRGNSYQPLTTILGVVQPTLSRVDVARRNSQEKKKTCSSAETLPVKNCPSGRTPRANDNPTGNNISALSATVYVARLVSSRGAFGEKPDPKFDVSMQSLETLNNRTVEACDIYLPDDSFAVNGVQDCCQPSQAPGHQICAG